MNIIEFLTDLQKRGIKVSTDGFQLRCEAKPDYLTPQLKRELKARKEEIIDFLAGGNEQNPKAIAPASRDHDLPLSYSQQSLWLIDQLNGQSPLYNMRAAFQFIGDLDISILERALIEIVLRHEILRTTFVSVNGNPVQKINLLSDLALPIVDLSGLPSGQVELEVDRLISEEAQIPFDLAQGPLIRLTLLVLGNTIYEGEREHILLFTLHHIVSDGWSEDIFIREFMTLYGAFLHGSSSPLGKLPIQYADYAVWQREWLQGVVLERLLSYWKNQLSGAPLILDLPTDYPRSLVQSYRGRTHRFVINGSLTSQLQDLSRRQGATLFMTLLAAFNILLSRYTGQQDICVGIPVANRTRSEVESLIGFFVNTLVLRTKLSGDLRFSDFLQEEREVCLGAQSHQDLPFEKLVEELQPVRDMGHHPVFQVMFVLQNTPLREMHLAGLRIEQMYIENQASKFDLTLEIAEQEDGLLADFEYSAGLFNSKTIEEMGTRFQGLLETIVAHPEKRLSEFPILTASETRRFIEWNLTTELFPEDFCLHELFEVQALKQPERIAVICGEIKLSYGELRERANYLAMYLQKRGVRPETRVALCMERSVETIIGIFGILKAGGVYVPMDPSHPAERIAELLTDCNASFLLTQNRLLMRLPTNIPKALCLDQEWLANVEPVEGDPILVHPSNAAYLIYTSGSTGKPKGVVISHKNAVASTFARFNYYPESPDGFLLLSPFAFDSSIAGIFWTLGRGGKLCLPPEGVHQDPNALLDIIAQEELSHLLCPPSFYSLILDYAKDRLLANLCTVIVAGESCSPNLAAKHYRRFPTTRLYNEYGPTEATVWSSVCEIQSVNIEDSLNVSIGRPIANTQMYILDDRLNQVPVGVPGEIYVGGAGIARGYYDRLDLTAARFLPNPFSSELGTRIYRTGDKGRFLSDGCIEFLGRVDHQVKIRGFRIELGEIEARLLQHDAVSDAVVLMREVRPGDSRLVAYIVGTQPDNESSPLSGRLREYLQATLPSYMVPDRVIVLSALPLNDNGKIDRNSLSMRDISWNLSKPQVEPRSSTEEKLTKMWMDVLGVEHIGMSDDFFALGGHSILAMQLVFRIRESFSCNLSLSSLFQSPTIASQAKLLVAYDDKKEFADVDSIDWKSESALDKSICPPSQYSSEAVVKSVLLTGATGFLGVFLLKELLERTRMDIYCLVRSFTSTQGLEKIKRSFDNYGLWDGAYAARIYPVCGDLSKPGLGIETSQWQELAGEIDTIYHNGALVNFFYPYSTLKPANVWGTQEVLRFACAIKVKPVHYISSVSVFEDISNFDFGMIMEDDFPEDGPGLVDGYAQSKWVAEKMVKIAGSRGLPVSIYRPSIITGDSCSGVWNTTDYLSKIIGACLLLGKVPVGEWSFNIVPVDYVSRALVSLSGQPKAIGKTYHLTNPNHLSTSQLVDLAFATGIPLERVDFDAWLAELHDLAGNASDHPFFSLISILNQEEMDFINNEDPYVRMPVYDCKNTVAGLSESGIICPEHDKRLWSGYFSYLQRAYAEYPSLVTG